MKKINYTITLLIKLTYLIWIKFVDPWMHKAALIIQMWFEIHFVLTERIMSAVLVHIQNTPYLKPDKSIAKINQLQFLENSVEVIIS